MKAGVKKVHVVLTADPGKDRKLGVAIPVWTPGYYQILDFQKGISGFRATDLKGAALRIERPNDYSWSVETTGTGQVRIEYDAVAEDAGFGFFNSHVDDTTGYINGASALMYLVEGKRLPTTVSLDLPAGWNSACPLDSPETGTYRAPDYDTLIDSPIQAGKFERLDFQAANVPFAAVLVGDTKVDRKALVSSLKRIAEAGIGIFGSAPFKRYIFFFHFAYGSFGGGLEHGASTVLNVGGSDSSSNPYAYLVAHEFFHAYNVKRLHPDVLGPFDYTQKVRTGALWWAEGVTDYYAAVLPRIAGMTTESDFLADMAGRIQELQQNGARLKVTAEEASRKAWEGGSFGFGGLSYYNKGSLLGLLFDIEIRKATGGAKSLDDVMRRLEEKYGKRGRGYEETGLLTTINEVAGKDLTPFYERYVQSTEEIPWDEILGDAGLQYNSASKVAFLGVSPTDRTKTPVVIESVVKGSPAEAAGIKVGDRIVSIDGRPVDSSELHDRVGAMKPGQAAVFRIKRGDSVDDLKITLASRDAGPRRIVPAPGVSETIAAIRAGLLRRKLQG